MLTFELADEGDRVEIHGDKNGLLKLAKYLEDLAKNDGNEHIHLMTEDWGGNELTREKQGIANDLVNHVKIFYWNGK